MQPLVSVIVPTKNSARTLAACLQSIKSQTYPNTELIVVDNFSSDTTNEIAQKYTAHVFQEGPERSTQRNFGVSNAQGKYVVIIDSDMVLEPQVVQECVDIFAESEECRGIVIPEISFGQGFRASCKKLERSFYIGVDRMEAARCFERDTYIALGGYDEHNIGTEDYDLPQRMQHTYGKKCIQRVQAAIHHDEGKLSLRRTCQKKFYYGQRLYAYQNKEANQSNFEQQSSIFKRYALFFQDVKKLFNRPLVGLGMLFLKTAEMTAGASGYFLGRRKKVKNIY